MARGDEWMERIDMLPVLPTSLGAMSFRPRVDPTSRILGFDSIDGLGPESIEDRPVEPGEDDKFSTTGSTMSVYQSELYTIVEVRRRTRTRCLAFTLLSKEYSSPS